MLNQKHSSGIIMEIFKQFVRFILKLLFRVEVDGLENYHKAGERVMIVANHTSFLDAVLLAIFLPDKITFAINTQMAKRWWISPFGKIVRLFPMDPVNPLSIKSFIKDLEQDKRSVIFPEGRITVTGTLMKIYDGPGLIALKTGANVLPIRIDGAQYSIFSRLKWLDRRKLFPKIKLTILPPQVITLDDSFTGRARRAEAGKILKKMMTDMIYHTSDNQLTIMDKLLSAKAIHGSGQIVLEDVERQPVDYRQLILKTSVLSRLMARQTRPNERVGLLLPNSNVTVFSFLALQSIARVPAMLNYTVGYKGMLSAIETAQIKTVYTSRRFIRLAKLGDLTALLKQQVKLVYLEDLRKEVSWQDKAYGLACSLAPSLFFKYQWQSVSPDDAAVVLFTSGSEGVPKGVVLSHKNIISNIIQLGAKIDFNKNDVILNALPLFHSFGLSTATLVPLLNGMKVFLYPSPLHYRIIPEVAYDINATMLFGTNTFLNGYARFAHNYDFYSVRYVCAGAEAVKKETREIYAEKFGLRILEGYGATETSPVISMNTPIDYKTATVGTLLPGMEYELKAVPGIEQGGQLFVRGPNIMKGYLRNENPGVLEPAGSELGSGWYDTGDIVEIDADGFIKIKGRVKRFAKIGGEMVSLSMVEEMVMQCWPEHQHAVVSQPDASKGEQLVLMTTRPGAQRKDLSVFAKAHNLGELNVPRQVVTVESLPLLGTGKTDYQTIKALLEAEHPES
jgi:acyl-[acyl-carrier-protein]-phospholipid O-acyltransferase/long-chain-fatty-acid--[acyl-carrier-protein] ligase